MRENRYLPILCVLMFLSLLVVGGCAKKASQIAQEEVTSELPAPAPEVTEEAPSAQAVPSIPEEELEEIPPQAAREKVFVETSPLKDVNFDFDKSAIRPDAAEILTANAGWLQENPDVEVLIEGHCDERGTVEYNLALGERRASSTQRYLINLGIDPKRLYTISYGEERPLDSRHNEEAWAKNRRAHFLITSEKRY